MRNPHRRPKSSWIIRKKSWIGIFDQRGWVPNAVEVIDSYDRLSRETREQFSFKTHAYGAHSDETLDVFHSNAVDAPIVIFVHGGAWINFKKEDFSFVAAPLVSAGLTTVILNFSKLPHFRLADVVDQVKRAIGWVCKTLATSNTAKVIVAGWSSGAHLAMSALVAAQREQMRPAEVAGAFCVSGPFDLVPVLLSARAAYVKVQQEDVCNLSPHRSAAMVSIPVFVASAEHDTDEFRRQSSAFADELAQRGYLSERRVFSDVNHFELIQSLAIAGSPLADALIEFSKRPHPVNS
jgi:arylformamidase